MFIFDTPFSRPLFDRCAEFVCAEDLGRTLAAALGGGSDGDSPMGVFSALAGAMTIWRAFGGGGGAFGWPELCAAWRVSGMVDGPTGRLMAARAAAELFEAVRQRRAEGVSHVLKLDVRRVQPADLEKEWKRALASGSGAKELAGLLAGAGGAVSRERHFDLLGEAAFPAAGPGVRVFEAEDLAALMELNRPLERIGLISPLAGLGKEILKESAGDGALAVAAGLEESIWSKIEAGFSEESAKIPQGGAIWRGSLMRTALEAISCGDPALAVEGIEIALTEGLHPDGVWAAGFYSLGELALRLKSVDAQTHAALCGAFDRLSAWRELAALCPNPRGAWRRMARATFEAAAFRAALEDSGRLKPVIDINEIYSEWEFGSQESAISAILAQLDKDNRVEAMRLTSDYVGEGHDFQALISALLRHSAPFEGATQYWRAINGLWRVAWSAPELIFPRLAALAPLLFPSGRAKAKIENRRGDGVRG